MTKLMCQENEDYKPDRIKAFQCDLTKDDLMEEVPSESVDLVTMVFVLSAIHPDKMLSSIQNIYSVLKPGGMVLFRDYGLNDHAMLRFSKGHKLADSFYVRQDGTRAFFFSLGFKQSTYTNAVMFARKKQKKLNPMLVEGPWHTESLIVRSLLLMLLRNSSEDEETSEYQKMKGSHQDAPICSTGRDILQRANFTYTCKVYFADRAIHDTVRQMLL
ncbi:putative methyltransferase-like protein 6 [Apostichopus japonicus]|uniref:Putative methyltransferase-like protein 6 n=1 Tax=Stichopus japonicus TaxID=307972 RepID=A0A2G8JVV7_STIJA|nr:putative methyltransferase-like protein 6 [Apostichopus japonicus]